MVGNLSAVYIGLNYNGIIVDKFEGWWLWGKLLVEWNWLKSFKNLKSMILFLFVATFCPLVLQTTICKKLFLYTCKNNESSTIHHGRIQMSRYFYAGNKSHVERKCSHAFTCYQYVKIIHVKLMNTVLTRSLIRSRETIFYPFSFPKLFNID